MISLMPYIGGKHRLASEIAQTLHSTGVDTVVDVFGGSGAILLNSGFRKRVYNDISSDLVTLFRVLSSPPKRGSLLKMLRWVPPSRRIFSDDYDVYLRGGFSFKSIANPVERARAVLYRQMFAFGGKSRSGGFACSTGGRPSIKEVGRYRSMLRRLVKIGEFFRETMIECLDYQDIVRRYGDKKNVVLFCDPPYIGTENYYSHRFGAADHAILAHLLSCCQARAVCTYYDSDLIRKLYPSEKWEYRTCIATANSRAIRSTKKKMAELILKKKATNGGSYDTY
jgi:DNA adenine methylase